LFTSGNQPIINKVIIAITMIVFLSIIICYSNVFRFRRNRVVTATAPRMTPKQPVNRKR
jgi:hypothetical protein